MVFTLIKNIYNYHKYKDDLVLNKYLIQTSKLKNLNTRNIKIRNFVMIKTINGFIDFRDNYFKQFKSEKNILVEHFYKMFGDYLIENSYYSIRNNYDIIINDYKKQIYIKEIIKDLFIIEFDNKQTLIYLSKNREIEFGELEHYIKHDTNNFMVFDLSLISELQIDELQAYFKLKYRQLNTLALLNKIVSLFNDDIKKIDDEEKSFVSIFTEDNIKGLTSYDFKQYTYLSVDYKVKNSELLNVASLGTTGGGKTIALNVLFLQSILRRQYRRLIYFDTQNSFKRKIEPNINPLYLSRFQNVKDEIFFLDETKFYLNETDFVNSINFLLEQYGYLKAEDKKKVMFFNYETPEQFKYFLEDFLIKERQRLALNKELEKLSVLERILNFSKLVKISDSSIFEDLENKQRFILILTFKDEIFFEVSAFLYFHKLKDLLYKDTELLTEFYADETQKYIKSNYIKDLLLTLVKEKRQYGFRFKYTGLSYLDIKEFFKYTQHIIFNSFNDDYIMNNLKSKIGKDGDLNLKTPFEKLIFNSSNNTAEKINLNINLLEYKNIK